MASAAQAREFLNDVRAGIKVKEHAPQAAEQDRRMLVEVRHQIIRQSVERVTIGKKSQPHDPHGRARVE
jgi:hypothetical protein